MTVETQDPEYLYWKKFAQILVRKTKMTLPPDAMKALVSHLWGISDHLKNTWLPIESYPFDDSLALFWNGSTRLGKGNLLDGFVECNEETIVQRLDPEPTHWMSLPTPPGSS